MNLKNSLKGKKKLNSPTKKAPAKKKRASSEEKQKVETSAVLPPKQIRVIIPRGRILTAEGWNQRG